MNISLKKRLQTIDERCDRYEADWRAQHPARIADYLEGLDEGAQRSALLFELVMLDQELRKERGETVTLEEYQLQPADQSIFLGISTDLGTPVLHDYPAPDLTSKTFEGRERSVSESPRPVQPLDSGLKLGPRLTNEPHEGQTDFDDLPSTIGEPQKAPDSDETRTNGEDVPSTVWGSPQERAIQCDAGVTDPYSPIASPGDPTQLPPGLVLGDYELIAKLAQGGMGVVYKARQISLNRIVALKTIKSGTFASDRETRLFQSEAEAIAALDHPGIVPILDVGEEDGQRYYSMKLIDGEDIQQCRARFENQPRVIAQLVAQIAEAIHHAHLRGVLHRDLKPANVLLDRQNQPHVVDWGLSKRLEVDGDHTTSTSFAGTPNYMAPEQAQGHREAITTVTDVYGLGTILYSLLTQRPPFKADSTVKTLRQVVEQEPQSPRSIDPRIDPDLETICLKCLEKDPRSRYASAQELASDLNHWLAGEPILARPVYMPERLWKWARRHRGISALVLLLHFVAILGLAGVLWQWNAAVQARTALGFALAASRDQEAQALRGEDRALRLAYAAKLSHGAQDWRDANIGHLHRILEETRPATGARSDLRGFEWFYLNGLCRKEKLNLQSHRSAVLDVAYSKDGTMLASASDQAIRLWDATTGHLIRVFPVQKLAYTVGFLPDGKHLIAGGNDRILTLWDLTTGQVVRTFSGSTERVYNVAISSDGRRLASWSLDGTVRVWETQTGKTIHTYPATPEGYYSIAFTADGKHLIASDSNMMIRYWEADTGKLVRSLAAPESSVTGARKSSSLMALSADGQWLASVHDEHTIHIRDTVKGRVLQSLYSPISGPWCMTFSPDGQFLAAAGDNQMVSLWERATGKPVRSFKGHTAEINRIAFSPDGKSIASASNDETVRIWDVTRDQDARMLTGHTDIVQQVSFSPDGRLLASCCRDRTIRLWDVVSGQPTQTLLGHTGTVRSVRFSPDGRFLASSGADETIKLWDPVTGRELRTLLGHTNDICRVIFSPDGLRLASASDDHVVRIWNPATGDCLQTLEGHTQAVNDLAFSPEGKTLLSAGNDGLVLLWDLTSGRSVRTIKTHPEGITAIAISPDGATLATSGFDRVMKLWDLASGQERSIMKRHTGRVSAMAFSPDGKRLVSASPDQTVRIWDPIIGEELSVLWADAGALWTLAFSPSGDHLATGGSGQVIRLWDLSTNLARGTAPVGP